MKALPQAGVFTAAGFSMFKTSTLTETEVMRQEASLHPEQGAVTAGYDADRTEVIRLLNQALATELVCVLRYRCHHFMARGIHSRAVAAEFLTHSNEELGHADKLAMRIAQLGGEPDFAPLSLEGRSHAEYTPGATLRDMIRANLVAERIAIQAYRESIQFLGTQDSTTSDLLKSILSVEEEHADDLASLLSGMSDD
jgi:bacterioferritin